MTVPKLTWSDYKDANGNWRSRVIPAEHIRALWARGIDLERELAAQADRIAVMAARIAALEARIAALEEAARVCIDGDNRDWRIEVERGIDMLRSLVGA